MSIICHLDHLQVSETINNAINLAVFSDQKGERLIFCTFKVSALGPIEFSFFSTSGLKDKKSQPNRSIR